MGDSAYPPQYIQASVGDARRMLMGNKPYEWTTPMLLQFVPAIANPILIALMLQDNPIQAFKGAAAMALLGVLTLFSVRCMVSGECTRMAWLYTSLSFVITIVLLIAIESGTSLQSTVSSFWSKFGGGWDTLQGKSPSSVAAEAQAKAEREKANLILNPQSGANAPISTY